MNSEQLELSLRSEFESYLKGVLAEMRQDATEFQTRIEAEFDKHKTQFDDAFRSFAERFDSTREFDEAFTGSVAEHLRLARDEGARITATAIAEAEQMEKESATASPAASFDLLRDAVNDISSKGSQSAILKSLVQHAAEFAPRGAFFVVKSGHFVGWKVFGESVEETEDAIREIHFSTSADSILSDALQTRNTVESSADAHSADAAILVPLHYGEPERMYAVPLIARGRSVAVLYADHGTHGGNVNREALETLVRVAGLTVELLASSHSAPVDSRPAVRADFEDAQHEGFGEPAAVSEPQYSEPVYQDSADIASEVPPSMERETDNAGFAFSENISFDAGFPQEQGSYQEESYSETAPAAAEEYVLPDSAAEYSATNDFEYQQFDSTPFDAEPAETVDAGFDSAHAFDAVEQEEPAPTAFSPFDQSVEAFEPAAVSSGSYGQVAEQVVEAQVAPVPSARLSDRPVDLPIEVPEEERRLHNDARRFARLLVSEIKLYNEKKVAEGREAQDLYERLREAIDRSREMYDKRVQPPVAAKFDYFHYEIVNSLADGEIQRLGTNYPGSSI